MGKDIGKRKRQVNEGTLSWLRASFSSDTLYASRASIHVVRSERTGSIFSFKARDCEYGSHCHQFAGYRSARRQRQTAHPRRMVLS